MGSQLCARAFPTTRLLKRLFLIVGFGTLSGFVLALTAITLLHGVPCFLQRDLKPQNLLLSDSSPQAVLKIADFGFARDLQPQVISSKS